MAAVIIQNQPWDIYTTDPTPIPGNSPAALAAQALRPPHVVAAIRALPTVQAAITAHGLLMQAYVHTNQLGPQHGHKYPRDRGNTPSSPATGHVVTTGQYCHMYNAADSRNGDWADKRIKRDTEAEMGSTGASEANANSALINRGVEMQSGRERKTLRQIGKTRRMAIGNLIQGGFLPVGFVDNNP